MPARCTEARATTLYPESHRGSSSFLLQSSLLSEGAPVCFSTPQLGNQAAASTSQRAPMHFILEPHSIHTRFCVWFAEGHRDDSEAEVVTRTAAAAAEGSASALQVQ